MYYFIRDNEDEAELPLSGTVADSDSPDNVPDFRTPPPGPSLQENVTQGQLYFFFFEFRF